MKCSSFLFKTENGKSGVQFLCGHKDIVNSSHLNWNVCLMELENIANFI